MPKDASQETHEQDLHTWETEGGKPADQASSDPKDAFTALPEKEAADSAGSIEASASAGEPGSEAIPTAAGVPGSTATADTVPDTAEAPPIVGLRALHAHLTELRAGDPAIPGTIASGLEPVAAAETDAGPKGGEPAAPPAIKGKHVYLKVRGMHQGHLADLAQTCARKGWKWESTGDPILKRITLPPDATWPAESMSFVQRIVEF